MFSTLTMRCTDNLLAYLVNHYLRFERMPFLFATVVVFLFFTTVVKLAG